MTTGSRGADGRAMLVLRVAPARAGSMALAGAEAVALLGPLGAAIADGGPLAEEPAVLWLTLPTDQLDSAAGLCARLGYTARVDLVVAEGEARRGERPISWRRRRHALRPLFMADPDALRKAAPDQRAFLLECDDGVVRRVRGYRGGRHPLTHRALPVIDARMLVNLAGPPPPHALLLDPFAGAGGIAIEARKGGWETVAGDVDRAVRFGLAELASAAAVADAARLPLRARSVAAIVTEPPYHADADHMVVASIAELRRVVADGGRVVMMAATRQAGALRAEGHEVGLVAELDEAVDRKGTDATVLVWSTPSAGAPIVR